MVPASQNVLLVVLGAQSLILLPKHLLQETNIGPDEDLDQIGSIEIMVELLNMILITPGFDFSDYKALVLFY